MDRTFTLDQARELLSELQPTIDEFVRTRAELTMAAKMADAGDPVLGVADMKGLEALVNDWLAGFRTQGVQVKGWAPLLLDFPGEVAGQPALLCWVEGESSLEWFHLPDHGFPGRRRIAEVQGEES
jgi:hypothetical protein